MIQIFYQSIHLYGNHPASYCVQYIFTIYVEIYILTIRLYDLYLTRNLYHECFQILLAICNKLLSFHARHPLLTYAPHTGREWYILSHFVTDTFPTLLRYAIGSIYIYTYTFLTSDCESQNCSHTG